jgi:hypothetical protein
LETVCNNVIALSATHGTGKSYQAYNIARVLQKKGFNVCVIDELARECPFEINQGAGWKTQIWIIVKQILREIELCGKYDYVIVDRSILDPFSYGKILNLLEKDDILFIKNILNKIYKKIYILDPIHFDYQIDDGIRDMDKEFRLKVHDQLLEAHKIHNVPTMVVSDESQMMSDIELLIQTK